MHRLTVFGVTGRMGQAVLRAVREGGEFALAGAVASEHSASLGRDAVLDGPPCGVRVSADAAAALAGVAVALDFSAAPAVAGHAAACAAAGVPLVVGTTGLDPGTVEVLREAAARIALLVAPNTSIGVNLLERLTAIAARSLGDAFDVEILEAHHRAKRDAPSGTAIRLGEAVAAARGEPLAVHAEFDRHGDVGPRRAGAIGFAVVRGGDVVGEHTVLFAGDGERIELTHRATDRMIFARGALRAAAWIVGRAPGFYRMQDVLGL
ncbi:MAG: 4-hydroxy-tetrahydrodipicolinate reductase [Gammaproteobacteria bacterium]|nr:4-hydroxy-tetrahydrodipicolinate reductase [Gammaproteobacteria bacterium]